MKGRLDFERKASRSFRNRIKLGKIKKRQGFSALIGAVAAPGKGINVDTLKSLIFQRLRIHFQIAPNDRKLSLRSSAPNECTDMASSYVRYLFYNTDRLKSKRNLVFDWTSQARETASMTSFEIVALVMPALMVVIVLTVASVATWGSMNVR
jgi:hypothetical protein